MLIFLVALFTVLGMMILLLIIALFTKKDYEIERNIIINKNKTEVFYYIKHIKNQDHYSTWNLRDPDMKKEYSGIDAAEGFTYFWDSKNKNVGKGEQEIKNIKDGDRLDLEIRFIKPFEGVGQSFLSTEALDTQQTKVRWGMKSGMKYPMNLMLLFLNMDKLLGKDLEAGLKNLKRNLEK